MRLRTAILFFVLVLRGLSPVPAHAQNNVDPYVMRAIEAVKTPTPPEIDGKLSEPCWKTAPKAQVFVDRQNGKVVADQTTAYLLYDAKYIYVGFVCKDSQPTLITARETIRDSKYNGNFDNTEDNVEVTFDPFQAHRQEDLTRFSVNAIGTPSARLGGGRGGKAEWKGDWDGAAKRTEDGWTAEMRIPWAILNYPNSKQPITMGINFTRYQDHTKLESVWSNTGSQNFLEKMGHWTGVQVPAGAFHPSLSLLPYLLPSVAGSGPHSRTGLDARYTITPELTAVATVNPEFATVEGAVQSVQFTRGERFVPDFRPFFLEGNDYFNNNHINIIGNTFYSSSITNFDLGSKLYGKIAPTDTIGLLHTINFGTRSDVIARYRHDFSPTSYGGFYLVQKSASDDDNTVAGIDQDTRWGKLELSTKWNLSVGHNAGGDSKEFATIYADKLLTWAFGVAEVSPLFRNADGFIPFNDYRAVIAQGAWSAEWRKGSWRNFSLQVTPTYQWHTDGRPFQRGANMNLFLTTRNDWGVGLNANYNKFDLQTDATIGVTIQRGVTNRFRQWGLHFETGLQGSRPSTFIGPSFSVRLFRRFDLSYAGALQSLNGSTQQHIASFNYELSHTRAIGGRLVVQDKDTNFYCFYKNSGGKGTNVFFVIGDPNAQRFVKRVTVKFVFAL